MDNNKCNYTGEKIYSAASYYYGAMPGVQFTWRMTFYMDEEIDKNALRVALDKCQKRYPYLMVKIKNTPQEMELVYNDLPVVIIEKEDVVTLGSEETNYHLIAFSYSGNKLVFSAFHGLLDGAGGLFFVKTLLYYYVMEKYSETPSSKGIRLLEDDICSDEYTDPALSYRIDNSVKPLLPAGEKKEVFRIEEDSRVVYGKPYCFYIKIPQDKLMNYCTTNDASPAALFSLIMARAVRMLNPETEKSIISGLAQNLRPMLNAPESHYSNVGNISLEFDHRIQELDFVKQNTAYRGRIILLSDDDTTKTTFNDSIKFYEYIKSMPTLQSKKDIVGNIVKQKLGGKTFTVSYVGKPALGDAEKHVKEIYSDADAPKSNIMIEVNSINENFCLSFMQEWSERLYFDAFCKQLKLLKLDYEITNEDKFKVANILMV